MGHREVALLLISQGATINPEDTADGSVLFHAKKFGFAKDLLVIHV
jgi:hypothetical protein